MISATASNVSLTAIHNLTPCSRNRMLVQQLRSQKPENVVAALKEMRILPPAKAYVPEHVIARTNDWTGRLESGRPWSAKYKSRLDCKERGQMSVTNASYKTLGEPVLDAGDLVAEILADTIPPEIREEYMKSEPQAVVDSELTTTERRHSKRRSASLAVATALPEAQAASRRCRAAGLDHIRGAIATTSEWIVGCRMGRRYMDEVAKTQCQKQEVEQAELERANPSLIEIKQFSDHAIKKLVYTSDAVQLSTRRRRSTLRSLTDLRRAADSQSPEQPHQRRPASHLQGHRGDGPSADELTSSIVLTSADGSQRQLDSNSSGRSTVVKDLTPHQHLVLDKFDFIYVILCSLYNLRPKHLRSKNPLNGKTLVSIRHDPFAVAAAAKDNNSAQSKYCGSRFGLNIRSAPASAPVETLPSAVGTSTSDQFLPSTAGGARQTSPYLQQQQQQQPSTTPHPSESIGSSISRFTPARNSSHVKRARQQVRGSSADNSSAIQIETWEELMHVGAKTKKQANRKIVHWQQDLTGTSESTRLQRKHANKTAKDTSSAADDLANIVYHFQESLAKAREKLQKAVLLELEKAENNRPSKFRLLFKDLRQIRAPLHIPERYFLHVRRLLADPEIAPELTVDWYEKLKLERHATHLTDNERMTSLMEKLHRFISEDPCDLENVREKMCLLVMSTPADEICTPACQCALVFVMLEILDWELEYLKQWLNVRRLGLLQFVEETVVSATQINPSRVSVHN